MEPFKKIIIGIALYAIFLFTLFLFIGDVLRFDEYVFFAITGLSNYNLLLALNLITYLGSSLFWLLLIFVFWFKKKPTLSIQLIFAFVIDSLLLLLLKNFFLRPRPFERFQLVNDLEFDIGPSFPSGHSERAFSGAVILSSHYKKYRIVFYSLATLVAFSRIYLGLHFPLDVIIGAINGIIVSKIAMLFSIKNSKINFAFR